MFGNLYDDSAGGGQQGPSTSSAPRHVAFEDGGGCGGGGPRPPRGRSASRLPGLENQGATCYLNSLIQVIAASPELRRAILSISAEQIAVIVTDSDGEPEADLDADGIPAKNPNLRRIPYELQRLLARLLVSDRETLSTRPLTRSFGWDSMQHIDQHDVQELNRLLFSALETSLEGSASKSDSSPYETIARQVRGAFSSSIRCLSCDNVSRRNESFFDLSVTTVSFKRLEDSLGDLFGREMLEGNNQYRCDNCQCLSDAEKTCRLTELPPILTLSLMRFDFDFARMSRVKYDGRFEFPMSLDVSRHLEPESKVNPDDALYDLYAVIIHSGSASGGHYHAYICDLEDRGTWTGDFAGSPSSTASPAYTSWRPEDSPASVLVQLLKAVPSGRLSADQVGMKFKEATRCTWKNECKARWGSITDFAKSQVQKFVVTEDAGSTWISLARRTDDQATPIAMGEDDEGERARKTSPRSSGGVGNQKHKTQSQAGPTEASNSEDEVVHWFDFNDSRVTPINVEDIKRQFSGRESAYMLFYRQHQLSSGTVKLTEAEMQEEMPNWLYEIVSSENQSLLKQRNAYEAVVNRVEYELYHESQFSLLAGQGFLWQACGDAKALGTVVCNRSDSIKRLLEAIENQVFNSNSMTSIGSYACFERTGCGYYAVATWPDSSVDLNQALDSTPIMPKGRARNPFVFVCFSAELPKNCLVGPDHRPIKLSLHISDTAIDMVFPASMSLANCVKSASDTGTVDLKRCYVYRESADSQPVQIEEPGRSLDQLGFKSGDRVKVVDSKLQAGQDKDDHQVVDVTIVWSSTEDSLISLRIRPGHKIKQLKESCLLTRQSDHRAFDVNEWRLEIFDEQLQCWVPKLDMFPVNLPVEHKLRLVQESPLDDEDVFVKVVRDSPYAFVGLVIHRSNTVSGLRKLAAGKLDLDPEKYHLCFVSPATGDALSELRDDRTLANSGVAHPSELKLVPGPPITQGQTRIRVFERLAFDADDWLIRLSQSPDTLFTLSSAYFVVNSSACVGDLPDLLVQAGLIPAVAKASVALFHRRGKQMTALLDPTAAVALAKKDDCLCFDLLCGLPADLEIAEMPDKQKQSEPSLLQPILLYVTSKSPGADDADYEPPIPLWWPQGDEIGDDSANSLYRAVERLAFGHSSAADEPEPIRLAKRIHERCEWLPIPLIKQGRYSQQAKAAAEEPLTNLKTADPYKLHDGDVIAWTKAADSGAERFLCRQDDHVLEQRRRNKARRSGLGDAYDEDYSAIGASEGGGGGGPRGWPVEKSLTINVPKYGPTGH